MMRLVRQIVVLVILVLASVCAFAQRKEQDKRPPKERVVVIENRKDNRPRPQNNNRPKPDKPKKP